MSHSQHAFIPELLHQLGWENRGLELVELSVLPAAVDQHKGNQQEEGTAHASDHRTNTFQKNQGRVLEAVQATAKRGTPNSSSDI